MSKDLRLQVVFSALDKLSGPIRKMSGGTKGLAQGVATTRKEITRLNREQKKIDGLKSLRKGLQGNNQKLDETRRKMRALRMEIDQSSRPTKTLTNALKAAERQEKNLTRSISEQSRKLNTQQSELKSSGVDVANLSRHEQRLARQIADANRKLDQQSEKLRKVQKFQERAGKVSSMAGRGGAAMTAGVTLPVAYLGKQSFEAAMNAMELQSAHDAVFGKQAAAMNNWAEKTGNALGRSTQRLQASNMAYQELFGKSMDPKKAAEMSKEMTLLTQDLASFKNLSDDEAQNKIFSGLVGESEPLRKLGVQIDEAMVKQKAQAMGMKAVKGQYSQQNKLLARAVLIKEQLATAEGDVIRTSGSAANQLKTLSDTYDEMKVKIGMKLLPKLTPFITKLAELLDRFNALSPETQNFILIAAGLLAALGPLLLIISGLASGAGVLAGAFGSVAAGIGLITLPILAVIAAVAVLAGAVYIIYKNWGAISAWFRARWEQVKSAFDGGLWGIIALLATWSLELLFMLKNAVNTATNAAVNWLINNGPGLFRGALNVIKTVMWDGLLFLPRLFFQFGVNTIQGLVNGISSMFGAVKSKISELADFLPQWIKKPLGIKSPSRVFMKLGGYISEGMAIGITSGGKNAIRAAGRLAAGVAGAGALSMAPAAATPIQRAASAASSMAGGNGGAGTIMNVTIKIDAEGKSAKELAKEIKKELEKLDGVNRRSDFDDGI